MAQRIKIAWKALKGEEQVLVRVIARDPLRLTVNDWKGNKDLVNLAARALADGAVRQMLDCLRTSHMGNYVMDLGAPIKSRAMFLARCEGYTLALNDFESLGTFVVEKPEVESEFKSVEEQEEQE